MCHYDKPVKTVKATTVIGEENAFDPAGSREAENDYRPKDSIENLLPCEVGHCHATIDLFDECGTDAVPSH